MTNFDFCVWHSLMICLLWGAWFHCILIADQGGCPRRLKFFDPVDGKRLEGHVFLNLSIEKYTPCEFHCLLESRCLSANIGPSMENNKVTCELNDADHLQHPDDLKDHPGWTYRGTESACSSNPCFNNGTCAKGYGEKTFVCSCPAGYTGEQCERGGWLLVYNVEVTSSTPSQLTVETSYRGISNYRNNKMILNTDAMKQLRAHLSFTQLRFHCSKPQGRTFHVTTAANSLGEAVVQFFSGQTNVYPQACGSFVPLDGDNSYLAADCTKWGKDNDAYKVGKWGHQGMRALNEFPAFIESTYHWATSPECSRWECDDFKPDPGDWKIYVR